MSNRIAPPRNVIVASILIFACFGGVSASSRAGEQQAPRTVTVRLSDYRVINEDNGILGNGVHMYFGYLVIGQNRSFGGTTTVTGPMKNNNGAADWRQIHTQNEKMFKIEVPEDTAILVKLNMIKSDQTTDKIRAAYAGAKLPVFGDGAFKGKISASISNNPASDIITAIASAANIVNNLLHGRALNTDDDYGQWTILIINDAGQMKASVLGHGARCAEAPLNFALPFDGKWHDFVRLQFKDDDNDISPTLEILPE